MKTSHKRHVRILFPLRIPLTFLALSLLLAVSPLSAQTSAPCVIHAKGVLESSDVELIQAQVLDGTRLVKVLPHGTRVTKGTPLLKFEPRQSQVEKARRQLLKAERELKSSLKDLEVLVKFTKERTLAELLALSQEAEREFERSKTISQLRIAVQRSKINAIQKEFVTAENKYFQFQRLAEENKVNQAQVEEYANKSTHLEEAVGSTKAALEELELTSERQLAEAELKMKLAKLDLAIYQNGEYIAQKEALETQIESAKEEIESSRKKYEAIVRAVHQTQLQAPADGIIYHHHSNMTDRKPFALEPGSRVQQGQVLLKFARLESKQVRVPVCETEILRLKEEQSATVRFKALPTQEYSATVKSISEIPRTEKSASGECVTYDVILDVVDLPAELKLGMTCDVGFTSK